MSENLSPTLVECSECELRAIRPTKEDAESIKQEHDSGDCPGEADLERRRI
jgi:hypothetical protein